MLVFNCGICGKFSFTRRRQRRLQQPTQIEIFSRDDHNVETWDLAILTCDPRLEYNIISRHLVRQVLQIPVHPIDEKIEQCIHTHGCDEKILGYVDLTWCFERNNKRIQTTRFWVTATENPCYDAVLGRSEAEQCGLIKAKKHW
ncbi:hypothetical protein ACJQWK_04129 [Exserohilum turcicum]|uniref:Uncharacterized protein n=1 Tax=Exserohilum turcicum (strain 28A) TaxID=671987 RepID=R0KC00_EXST2|nr:uncharacterized protein SETTUDRAFT_169548 [Exserohilum turcica Et28A]EOA85757.1 hypothetical protein SETTUDRAFT_169548 [Exserohilum turcica Et28A]